MHQVELIIKRALVQFHQDMVQRKWKGREREAVSHFVTGHLINCVSKDSIFKDLSQAVIEGAVKQWDKVGKKQVNKDLLIWPDSGMTTWNSVWEPEHVPLAILEWKVYRQKNRFKAFHQHDVEWLEWWTTENTGTLGVLVALDISTAKPELYAGLVKGGLCDKDWLLLK